MLGKLIKHELKATSRLLVPLYIALLCISVINHFTFNYGAEEGVFAVITGFLFMIQSLFTVTIVIITIIFMIARFYKNFLSNEGYLMFTLPVSSHKLILSKLIVTLFWTFISALSVAISWFIVSVSANNINLFSFTMQTVQTLFEELNTTFGFGWVTVFIQLVVLGILFLVGNILLVYTSIAIGQLFKKYKLVISFVFYIVIRIIIQVLTVSGIVGLEYTLGLNETIFTASNANIILLASIITGFIGCTIFYTATNYIFKRKLNLE